MRFDRGWVAAVAAVVLCGCGGGGGGGGEENNTGPRAPLPTLSQDIAPEGARLDLRDRNYFPAAPGDTWHYQEIEGDAPTGQTATRTVNAGPGSDVLIVESVLGTLDSTAYRRTAEGIVAILPLSGLVPEVVSQFVGDILEYPEPFYPVGATRRIVRQGNWGVDVDGDGVPDSYRIEISQVLVGIGPLTMPTGTLADVAHFRNVTHFTLQPSDRSYPSQTVTSTENAWWAPGIGLVRAERTVANADGALAPPYTLVLTGGSVAGAPLLETLGGIRKLSLVHNALVFDRTRSRYYASIPGSVAGTGNRIAVIDPATGAVSHPGAAVGSEPFAMAISADGNALYVGLNGSGDVVKLRLPDMVELWRERLPAPAFYGQLFAERIAVSPVDADVIAVSTFRTSVSPRHGGVVLIRDGIRQPIATGDHTGSNLIAFDASGQYVYGFNNESTEFGLRRIAVLANGLNEEQVVAAMGNFGTRTLDWSAHGLVLDKAVYRAPDLALMGQANVTEGGCRPHTVPNRLVCEHYGTTYGLDAAIAVVDATTFVILAAPVYQPGYGNSGLTEIVPGPPGQVALRMNATYWNQPADSLWLFKSAALE